MGAGEQAIWIALNPADVPALEALLSNADPFVASTIATDAPYRLADYVIHSRVAPSRLCALLDRNLIARATGLACGQVVDHERPDSDSYRVAAACMAFLLASEVLIEPNISLYELSQSIGREEVPEHLLLWRVADHIHPQAYLEIALRRANAIDPDVLREARRDAAPIPERSLQRSLELPLSHWRRHRCAVSQVALLERGDETPSSKMHSMIDWSVDVGFFDGIALAFAAMLFGSSQPGPLLRGVQSPSWERCIASIDNAAWDLTYVSYWMRSAKEDEGSRLWIFCTNDRTLARVARASVAELSSTRDLFTETWRKPEADALRSHYEEALRAVQSANRGEVVRARFDEIDGLTNRIRGELSRFFREHAV